MRRLHSTIGDVPPAELEAFWSLLTHLLGIDLENGAVERAVCPANYCGGMGHRAIRRSEASSLTVGAEGDGWLAVVAERDREEVLSSIIDPRG